MTWLIGGVVFLGGFYLGMVVMAMMAVSSRADDGQ